MAPDGSLLGLRERPMGVHDAPLAVDHLMTNRLARKGATPNWPRKPAPADT